VRAVAGRAVVCRLRRPRRGRGALRVAVRLVRLDGAVVTRTVAVRVPQRHRH
jgi:hypothetical protein